MTELKAGGQVAGRPGGLVRPLLRFVAAESVAILLMAWGLGAWIWSEPAARRAVWDSAWLAIVVQIVTFAIARLVAREQVMAGWGLGVLIRFATVAGWAFLGIKALGLPVVPALLSLVAFYFVSTLIEPFFLNA